MPYGFRVYERFRSRADHHRAYREKLSIDDDGLGTCELSVTVDKFDASVVKHAETAHSQHTKTLELTKRPFFVTYTRARSSASIVDIVSVSCLLAL